MQPISGMTSRTIQPLAIAGTEPAGADKAAEQRPRKPVQDTYTPEEKQEPSGRYWLGKDEDGRLKIYFDAPEQAADSPEKAEEFHETEGPEQKKPAEEPEQEQPAEGPDKPGGKEKRCTVNTDQVDREIKRLKEKKKELEQELKTGQDGEKAEQLKKELARINGELSQKDNDTYRRQHAQYTNT